jgi:hypothetical protein
VSNTKLLIGCLLIAAAQSAFFYMTTLEKKARASAPAMVSAQQPVLQVSTTGALYVSFAPNNPLALPVRCTRDGLTIQVVK